MIAGAAAGGRGPAPGRPLPSDRGGEPEFGRRHDSIPGGAVRHAVGEFDAWAELTAAHPGTRPLSDFDGQRDWLAQPAVQAVATAAATPRHLYFTFPFLLADPVVTLADGRDAYLARAAAQALSTYIYITFTDDWLSEEPGNCRADEHALALSSYLESVAPDTILARVRCHA